MMTPVDVLALRALSTNGFVGDMETRNEMRVDQVK